MGIATGPGKTLWVADHYYLAAWRVTTSGKAVKIALPSGHGDILNLTEGPDGALWYTDEQDSIGRGSASAAGSG